MTSELNDGRTIFIALRNILAFLYPEEQDARRIVDDAGLPSIQITFRSSAVIIWHNILTEAIRQDRVGDLIQAVLSNYSNKELQTIVDQYYLLIKQGGQLISTQQWTFDSRSSQTKTNISDGKTESQIKLKRSIILKAVAILLALVSCYLALASEVGTNVIGTYNRIFVDPSGTKASQASLTSVDTPTPPPLVTATPVAIDTTSLVRFQRYRNTICDDPAVLPAYLDPTLASSSIAEKFGEALSNGSWTDWPKAPLFNAWSNQIGGTELPLRVQHILRGGEWIELSNKFQIKIHVSSNFPDHVNIIRICEGVGQIRTTPKIVSLQNENIEYTVETEFPDGDFYTLEPGAFEVFSLRFQCSNPGLYTAVVRIPYSYAEQSGYLEYVEKIICPKIATMWSAVTADGQTGRQESFMWSGDQYVLSSAYP
jgi:hypothetical protein